MNDSDLIASREYKQIEIPGVVVVRSRKYFGVEGGWLREQSDFSELTSNLGYRFDARVMYTIWSPPGVIRGGHLEGRSKTATIITGAAFMALVDMRPGEQQGKAVGVYLGNHDRAWGDTMFIPEGVLNAFVPLNNECLYTGVGDRPFNRFDSLRALDLFDPELGLEWPAGTKPQDSHEEKEILSLREFIEKL